jgi:hypothetical protein
MGRKVPKGVDLPMSVTWPDEPSLAVSLMHAA